MIVRFIPQPFKGNIDLPASKSISNRVLMIQAMCSEWFSIRNLSAANDTLILQNLLHKIVDSDEPITLDAEDAGTPFRFLTSYLAMQEGKEFILTGTKRLCERPIEHLVTALQSIGADIQYINKHGFAPLLIKGKKLTGGNIQISGKVSSQFISSLCLIAPCLPNGLTIDILNKKVSDSYIQMTLGIMKEFGIQYTLQQSTISIPAQVYSAKSYEVENDWSSATFFYAMAMLSDHAVCTLHGLKEDSLQGDSFMVQLAHDMGIETTFNKTDCILKKTTSVPSSFSKEYNLSSYPDLAIPFIVVCALIYPNIKIRGIEHLQLKESNRITALQTELAKINIELIYTNDVLSFIQHPKDKHLDMISFCTYHDHRIAMALSMITLTGLTVSLDDVACVEKSFPDFFLQAERFGIQCVEEE